MKKKTFLIVLSVVLVLTAAVLGTLAFLTDDAEAVNTFTVGKVAIELYEAKVNEMGEIEPGDEDKRVTENQYRLIPGQTYIKDPTMTVKKGSEESYVRMMVTVNNKADLDAIFAPTGADLTSIFVGYDKTVWNYVGMTEAEDTRVYEFRYHTTVKDADENNEILTADEILEPLFTSIKVPDSITSEQLATISDLEIKVQGHAIQALGFDDADAAWAGFAKQMNQ